MPDGLGSSRSEIVVDKGGRSAREASERHGRVWILAVGERARSVEAGLVTGSDSCAVGLRAKYRRTFRG
jgi:hypothetical protein